MKLTIDMKIIVGLILGIDIIIMAFKFLNAEDISFERSVFYFYLGVLAICESIEKRE